MLRCCWRYSVGYVIYLLFCSCVHLVLRTSGAKLVSFVFVLSPALVSTWWLDPRDTLSLLTLSALVGWYGHNQVLYVPMFVTVFVSRS